MDQSKKPIGRVSTVCGKFFEKRSMTEGCKAFILKSIERMAAFNGDERVLLRLQKKFEDRRKQYNVNRQAARKRKKRKTTLPKP